ncbi:unnamed protein product [Cuscuta campestris]|uniref:DYW domain-containing protein n=1 Tax=Cuscuta campestris TaxID=132261 RepID=A0A484NEC4_9ASTE|nr:unnamed protein product [Cuscuta campestris]
MGYYPSKELFRAFRSDLNEVGRIGEEYFARLVKSKDEERAQMEAMMVECQKEKDFEWVNREFTQVLDRMVVDTNRRTNVERNNALPRCPVGQLIPIRHQITQLVNLGLLHVRRLFLDQPVVKRNETLVPGLGIRGHLRHGRRRSASGSINRLLLWRNVVPDGYTLTSLLRACSTVLALREGMAVHALVVSAFVKFGKLTTAKKLFDEMPERNVISFTIMIDGCAKAGDMVSARFLFDQSNEKDIIAWSAMISGYAQNGQPVEAVKLFFEMMSINLRPDEFVMVSLMSACSQIGCLDLARRVDCYVMQSSFNLHQPHVAAALVDMNAKCGNMDRAMALFEEIPKRDVILYCSLMQALSKENELLKRAHQFEKKSLWKHGSVHGDHCFSLVVMAAPTAATNVQLFFSRCSQCHALRQLKMTKSIEESPDWLQIFQGQHRLQGIALLVKVMMKME